jgi:hypothetical protein
MSSPSRDSGNGWLLLIIIGFLALSGGGAKATTPPANPHYVVPSCTGVADVPGFNACHK